MDAIPRWPLWVLLLVAVLIYAPALGNGFVWDDHVVVVNNSGIRHLLPLSRFFSAEGPLKQRPLMSFSLALDRRIWGLNPFGFHLTNLLLHLLCCSGVYLLGLRLLRSFRAAFSAALLFTVHPVHAEAVSALLGRSDLMAAAASLWGFLGYLEASQRSGRTSFVFFLLSLLLFGGACLSKETGLALLGWVVLYEALGLSPMLHSRLEKLVRILPFLLIAASYLVFWYGVSRPVMVKTGWWGGSVPSHLLMSAGIFWEYLRLLVFPLKLSPWYVVPVPQSLWDLKTLLGMLAFLGALSGFVVAGFRRPLFGFLLGGYLVAYLPLSNLVPIPGSMMAERWLYPATVLFSLGVGLVWVGNVGRLGRPYRVLAHGLVVLTILLLSFRTVTWSMVWRTDFTLFGTILRQHPRVSRAHLWLAEAYNRADSLSQAEKHYRVALALTPEDPGVHAGLGILYDKQRRYEKAVQEYKIALRLGGERLGARLDLGITYEHLGKYEEALTEYKQALSSDVYKSRAYFRMGECYRQIGDSAKAKEAYIQALSVDPTSLDAQEKMRLLER